MARRRPFPSRAGRLLRRLAGGAALTAALLALPILLGYLEGPRFPVANPGPWEALKQVGRDLRFLP